jgi:hypothetical protein
MIPHVRYHIYLFIHFKKNTDLRICGRLKGFMFICKLSESMGECCRFPWSKLNSIYVCFQLFRLTLSMYRDFYMYQRKRSP